VLIAHRIAAIRDRFAVALADARHEAVAADSDLATLGLVERAAAPFSLALVDLGLSPQPLEFVRAVAAQAAVPLPIMVFSGSLRSAADVPPLVAMNVGFINEYASTPQILPALAPHLFPDNFNRRGSLRVPIGVPVTYRTEETLAGAVTLDVGAGGLSIRTMTPLPKGANVQVKFRLPGTSAEIDAAGRVAWSDRHMGMGVQFDQVSSNHQRTIKGFLAKEGVRS
jgi:uncharacterized protein (TIGR02266 family)